MQEDYYVLYKKEDGYYYYYFYRYNKRVRRSTGCKRKTDAILVANERMRRGDLANEGRHTKFQTFREYSEPFFVWDRCPIIRDKVERGGHFSQEYAYICRKHIEKYLLPAFGAKVLPELTPAMISSFLRNLPKKSGITPQTANKVLSVLRMILDYAITENIIEDNPAKRVKPLVPNETRRGCFTTAQIKTIFKTPWKDLYVELACRLASMTGMRLGEIRGLLRDNVFEDYILVEHSYSNREKLKSTKNGKSRKVPIPPELAETLRSVPNNGPYVFSYNGDIPLWGTTIEYKLREHLKECKIDAEGLGLSFHSFRHFFNTQLIAADINQHKIQAVIGHSSIAMTSRYEHLEVGDLTQIRNVQSAI